MTGIIESLGPIAPHVATLLSAAQNGATFSELMAHPAATSLINSLKAKAEVQPTLIFSKCPDCGFRYETTI